MRWELDAFERKELEAWDKAHLADAHDGKEPYSGAIGGRLTFMVTGTSLGEIVKVRCCLCGHEHYLTNWDDFG